MASNAADRPLIGITTYLEQSRSGVWDVPASFLPRVYLDAVTDAGGIAVLLPPQPADDGRASEVIDRIDGLLVAGGADVDPRRYGQEPVATTGAPREDRDAWEDALLRAAIDTDLPFLGICRGMQLLNVALGGTLHQHLPDVVGDTGFQPEPGVFGAEAIEVEPESALGEILSEHRLTVPVYHHQSVDAVAPALVVTARARGDVVQALELPTATHGVAVQWHPEQDAADRRLFASLVDAARKHRDSRRKDPS